MKKVLAFILALALATGSCYGLSVENSREYQITKQLKYVSANASEEEGFNSEHYFEYTPGADTLPYICYGNDVAGAASLSKIVGLEGEQGNTIVGATNADFFDMSNGIAVGCIIKNGIIRSSEHSSHHVLGFTDEGKAAIGRMGLVISVSDETGGVEFANVNFNKKLTNEGGFVLYSKDFGDSTLNSPEMYALELDIQDGQAVIGGTITCVAGSTEKITGSKALSEGKMYLCILTSSYQDSIRNLGLINPGDTVKISFSADASWAKYTQVCGVEERLIVDGEVQSFKDKSKFSRTAVGIRKDGTLVLYTVDGGQEGSSRGLSYAQLAQRMKDFGCIQAANLDGGTSTQLHVQLPGYSGPSLVNPNSGTTIKRAADYICFRNTLPASGELGEFIFYDAVKNITEGAVVQTTVKSRDTNYYAISIPAGGVKATWDGAELSCEYNAESGLVRIGLPKADGFLHHLVVKAYDELGNIGRLAINVQEEAEEEFSEGELDDFGFGYFPGIEEEEPEEGTSDGAIEEAEPAEAVITPETQIFKDMPKDNVFTPYAEYMFRNHIMDGSFDKDGNRVFNPNSKLNRQGFCKVVVTWLGIDLSLYEDVELPFTDISKIATWAIPYIKAAYSLGLISGKSSGKTVYFDPTGGVTRQQALAIIGRSLETGYKKADISGFKDADQIASYAYDNISVLVEMGVINGSAGKLNPKAFLTRAQAAKIIYELN